MDATLITVFLRLKEPQVNAACELKEMVLVLKSAIYVDFFVWLFFFSKSWSVGFHAADNINFVACLKKSNNQGMFDALFWNES